MCGCVVALARVCCVAVTIMVVVVVAGDCAAACQALSVFIVYDNYFSEKSETKRMDENHAYS